jgi:uncharacterized RDD family membrane protein YckC
VRRPSPPGDATQALRTPEGVTLSFETATLGDRVTALLLDLLLLAAIAGGLLALTAMATAPGGGDAFTAFALLVVFLLQNFYFVWFEARGGGTTPGKRRLGIRVVDAAGGPLTTEAIVVRNLTRIVEIWVPLAVLLAPQGLTSTGSPALGWLSFLWVLAFAAVPLVNARRLRVGDLVAGTRVVRAPVVLLLPDVGTTAARRVLPDARRHVFTPAMLSVYGIYELQVLEEILRPAPGRTVQEEALRAVAGRIATKIEWPERVPSSHARAFLEDYYAALRQHLETRLLFGQRKEDKFSEPGR